MKQFCFSLSLRNAMNSTLQNRDIRDNQWNASLFLCRGTSFQKRVNRICLSAPLHAPPAPAEQVPSRTSSPSLAPLRLIPLNSSTHSQRRSTCYFFPLSFSNISLNAAAANSPSECTCASGAVRALSDWRRLPQSRARTVV